MHWGPCSRRYPCRVQCTGYSERADMGEELSLRDAGGIILSEGLKFLYNEASELLKNRRSRKGRPKASSSKFLETYSKGV